MTIRYGNNIITWAYNGWITLQHNISYHITFTFYHFDISLLSLLGYERHFNILLHTTISSSQSHFTITLSLAHYTYTIGLAYNMDGLKDITWGQFKLYYKLILSFWYFIMTWLDNIIIGWYHISHYLSTA